MTFHWAARTIDAWLGLVRWARAGRRGLEAAWRAREAAWRALPGDLLALLVMRCCGITGPGREVHDGDVSALMVEDPRTARYLDHQAMPVYAQTLGRYVFARERLPEGTVAHEIEHVRQWRRLGPLFLPAYFASSGLALLRGRHPYDANRFEQAARRRERGAGS